MVKPTGTGGYHLWLEPEVYESRHSLPANVRQRVKKLVDGLRLQPRPGRSRALDVADLPVPELVEIRRVRLDNWRIIYAVNDREKWVWVLAIRRRPPYDYEDLAEVASRLAE